MAADATEAANATEFKIISIHSFRRGTGKSSLVANLAALLATCPLMEGRIEARHRRVCAIDTNIQSPSLPLLFGLDDANVQYTLNDYLLGRCEIEQAAYTINLPSDSSPSNDTVHWTRSPTASPSPGEIILVPASMQTSDIAKILRRGYDIDLLHKGLQRLVKTLDLDIMVIDTYAGLNEETLPLMALADNVIILLRPDPLEYQGTAVMIDITQQLEIPDVMLLVNQVPMGHNAETEAATATRESLTNQVNSEVEQTYKCPVIAVLPASNDMMTFASNRAVYPTGIFVHHYPNHPITATLKKAASRLVTKGPAL